MGRVSLLKPIPFVANPMIFVSELSFQIETRWRKSNFVAKTQSVARRMFFKLDNQVLRLHYLNSYLISYRET